MAFFCRIYVDEKEIYSGDLSEVPERFRGNIRETLSDWADSLGKRGLNELVYSLFTWYDKKGMYCRNCDAWQEGEKKNCSVCDGELVERYIYERDERLNLLLTCVGVISRIEVSEEG
ncbi:MAG TPA: hypothetical protein VHT73_09965 [Thermodesulfobacteriota bacterium]|nr:hypothetical protein [Thermodesulfobacteriota bacterium]